MDEDRYGGVISNLAASYREKGVKTLLDQFFAYLHDRTDFYVVRSDHSACASDPGYPPGVAEDLVLKAFKKYPPIPGDTSIITKAQEFAIADSMEPQDSFVAKEEQLVSSDLQTVDISKGFPEFHDDIEGLPNISGWEDTVATAIAEGRHKPSPLVPKAVRFRCAWGIALHMHQPMIPAGDHGEMISHLKWMFDNPGEPDNWNAGPFTECYSRMGHFVPDLVSAGAKPKVMLDYSGSLLWGLRQMKKHYVLDNLKKITSDPRYAENVEWLGTTWAHAVIPSTPVEDIFLQIRAWQHHFASIFGLEALKRVQGFSPPELALPSNPDVLYAFVKALNDTGYRWMLVQEHTIETLDGKCVDPKIPYRLVARNSDGETASIVALVKSKGSDTKLVGQMQPYSEAKHNAAQNATAKIPNLFIQIGDGENGGVMMNEFPRDFVRVFNEIKGSGEDEGVRAVNGSEYLDYLEELGISEEEFPSCQATGQYKLWNAVGSKVSKESVQTAIDRLKKEDSSFHMEGMSWTSHISWEKGYENVIQAIQAASSQFHSKTDLLIDQDPAVAKDGKYRRALYNNLLLQSSCFRYWGQGRWTDYAIAVYKTCQHHLETSY